MTSHLLFRYINCMLHVLENDHMCSFSILTRWPCSARLSTQDGAQFLVSLSHNLVENAHWYSNCELLKNHTNAHSNQCITKAGRKRIIPFSFLGLVETVRYSLLRSPVGPSSHRASGTWSEAEAVLSHLVLARVAAYYYCYLPHPHWEAVECFFLSFAQRLTKHNSVSFKQKKKRKNNNNI